MKRTPIITQGQVYLHPEANEYLVVTGANKGEIKYKGPGFSGMHDVELFLDRFGPVDPTDLSDHETASLQALVNGKPLLTGWVQPDDDGDDTDEE